MDKPATATLIGAPWDGSSSYLRGAAAAPVAIRRALWSPSTNSFNERGDDLRAPGLLHDAGDAAVGNDGRSARLAIEDGVRRILEQGGSPIVLGGDHSITYPVLRAYADRGAPPSIVHFDAHADLYDRFPLEPPATSARADDGSESEARYSHACPFARIMERQLAARLIQIGIRTLTEHQRAQAERFGVEIYAAARWHDVLPVLRTLSEPVYVSLDLDVLEPMLAPGLSHPEPGGLSVREVLDALGCITAPVVGADVVEYNPSNDVRDLTAHVAAKFVRELVGLMKRRS